MKGAAVYRCLESRCLSITRSKNKFKLNYVLRANKCCALPSVLAITVKVSYAHFYLL